MWTDLMGQEIPDTGDPEYAKQLIADSGEPMPPIRYDYAQSPTADKTAASLVESYKRCGINATANPIDSGQYYGIVLDPAKRGALINGGWGPDWGNASTIIPELVGEGGWNLSDFKDNELNAGIADALTILDPEEQQGAWNELNAEAMSKVPVIPTLFTNLQRMAGSKVVGPFIWAPYGSWNYGTLAVEQ
jgi:peptide/nickel transport system substrate-binding protein